ncbi:hypothetical protein [Gracilimonas sp.]|uniref:hypothetical protein n=1 Tax=Gracilimonas sp. TaxID=1974203 RepID=UPI002870DE9B|nr:hypothetical protein [Gracilimonas sp.]
MKTLANNNTVIAKGSATFGSKPCGNLYKSNSEPYQGDRFVDYFENSNLNPESPRDDGWGLLSRFILIGLITLLLSSLSFAQDFDTSRMNRDIKIMENVLGELFKIESESKKQKSDAPGEVRIRSISNNFAVSSLGSRGNQVSGNYIPGYGIIFKVPYLLSTNISSISVVKNEGEQSISFYYDSDENSGDNQVTEETVVQRITNFLKDYAPTIGQLADDEQVTIVYGEKKDSSPTVRIFNLSGEKEEETEIDPIPVITVSAKASDLTSLRSGRLSSDNFEDRLLISKKDGNEKERLDLEVMANILETAFEDGDETGFHLVNSNSLSYVTIDGFGVHYTLDMHRGHGLQTLPFGTITSFGQSGSAEAEESAQKIREAREKRDNEMKFEYQNLTEQMKTYLVDYGRTLNSLNNEQFIIVSVNITDYRDIVPAQVNFQLQKSVLQQLDRGQISRDDAINAVTITEY